MHAAQNQEQAYFADFFTQLEAKGKIRYLPFLSQGKNGVGRLRADMVVDMLSQVFRVDERSILQAFLCGPYPLMRSMRIALVYLGLAPTHIKSEYFEAPPTLEMRVTQPDIDVYSAVYISETGRRVTFDIIKGQSVLDAALVAGVALPYSCNGGVCGTCQARLISGNVAMRINEVLTDIEMARGAMLTCTALPMTESVLFER